MMKTHVPKVPWLVIAAICVVLRITTTAMGGSAVLITEFPVTPTPASVSIPLAGVPFFGGQDFTFDHTWNNTGDAPLLVILAFFLRERDPFVSEVFPRFDVFRLPGGAAGFVETTKITLSAADLNFANDGLEGSNLEFVVETPTWTSKPFDPRLEMTGILDGTLTGGAPKVVELFALQDIPDLSIYSLGRAFNGQPDFGSQFALPAIALNKGDFFYAVGNQFDDMADRFDLVFPTKTGDRALNFGVNSNGDDVTGLFLDNVLVDVFGELGVDGTGTAWEHIDSWAYRKDGTFPSPVFNVDDWNIQDPNLLDGFNAGQINDSFPDGTFVAPEPGTLSLLALGGVLLRRCQRRYVGKNCC